MPSTSSRHWLLARRFTLVGPVLLLLSLLPLPTVAEESGPTLLLRPHCEQQEQSTDSPFGPLPDSPLFIDLGPGRCRLFPTSDPLTMETPILSTGETLDMDLIVQNPSHQSINRVRAWIAYDPTILEGAELTLTQSLPLPSPGEADFSQSEGYVKLHVSNPAKGPTDDPVVIARIQMRVIAAPSSSTTMSFYDAGTSPKNHTALFRGSGLLEQSIFDPSSLGQLRVRLEKEEEEIEEEDDDEEDMDFLDLFTGDGEAEDQASSVPPPPSPLPSTSPSPLPPLEEPTAIFTLLQVQNLRTTTEGSSVFLAWDPLPSAQLTGYNLYYGTISGQHAQRRSMDSAATSMVLRALPKDKQYFFTIRGFSEAQTETAPSQEVTIIVGNPTSSSAPLRGSITEREQMFERSPHALAGRTGTPSLFLIVLLGSAGIGTAIACRRQYIASTHL